MNEYDLPINEVGCIILTFICPPLGLIASVITLFNHFGKWKNYIFCIAWCMASFSYCYAPLQRSSTDLIRYFAYAEKLGAMPLNQIWGNGIHGEDTLYVFEFFCWLVGKLGDVHLLPAISSFFVYYIGMYVTCTIADDNHYQSNEASRYILFILLTISFYSITNNVRNILAFSIVGLAIFRDIYQDKKGFMTITMYILPILIHPSAAILWFVRLFMPLVSRAKVISIFVVLLVPKVLELMDGSISFIGGNLVGNTIIKMVHMGNSYFHDDSSGWAIAVKNSGAQKLGRVAYMFLAACFLYLCYQIYRDKGLGFIEKPDNRQEAFLNFPFFALLLVFSCIPMTQPQYWRFVSVLILFGAQIYLMVSNSDNINTIVAQKLLYLPSVLCPAFWIREMILYSDIAVMMMRSFFCNPFVILGLRAVGKTIECIG